MNAGISVAHGFGPLIFLFSFLEWAMLGGLHLHRRNLPK